MPSDLKQYAPQGLLVFKEYDSLLDTENEEFNSLSDSIDGLFDQYFVNSATWGLDRWEEFLGLESYAGKPVEHRRSRIISKIRGVGTVTVKMIKNVAESYDGGTVDVTEQPEQYTFTIKFVDTKGIPPNLDDLKEAIEEIKPAHLAVEYAFTWMTWSELEGYNKTWDEWDTLNLTWDEFETYREVI